MNFAFTALLILFLALPGLFAMYAYRSERGRSTSSGTIADEVPLGLIVATVFHSVWIMGFDLIGCLIGVRVDLNSALTLLAAPSNSSGELFMVARRSVTHGFYPLFILLYFATICVAAAAGGRYFRNLVRTKRWDKTIDSLRWNDWFYLFQGESPDGSATVENFDAVRVTAVVGDFIYWGIIVDFVVDKDGALDSVVLANPHRRKIGDDEQAKPEEVAKRVHDINAHYLVLKYSECSNMAILGVSLVQA